MCGARAAPRPPIKCNNFAEHALSTQGRVVRGRVLVCADGAPSRLATRLGYCTEAPKGICSRAYVEGGTHNTEFDGAGLSRGLP